MRIKQESAELWVFGYGSLMWRPDFDFSEQAPAALIGAHRSLCIYSFHHRGTPDHPGLVLGLDEGGACRGVAFRVAPDKAEPTLAYLREREQVTDVYVEAIRPVSLLDGSGRELEALCSAWLWGSMPGPAVSGQWQRLVVGEGIPGRTRTPILRVRRPLAAGGINGCQEQRRDVARVHFCRRPRASALRR
jgi:cation transport protein ChaC